MKQLKNDKGIALVTALLLTLISLTFMMAVLYLLTQGVRTSASTKHYATALEATYGGVDFFTKDALPQMLTLASSAFVGNTLEGQYTALSMDIPATVTDACLQDKLTKVSSGWSNCNANNKTTDITQLKDTADMKFTFPGTQGSSAYTVYAKIVDTVIGNTDTSQYAGGGLLIGAGVARSAMSVGGGNTPSTKIPYLFDIEIQGEASVNPQERTRVNLFYAF
jgi:hypothetical protein